MRTIKTALIAALFIGTPLAAQNTALAIGGGRAAIRIDAAFEIPVYVRATATQTLTETFKGTSYTEYLATYTVRANTRWDLVTTATPEGVTLLAQDGEWTAGATTIGNGAPTNGATVLVRVRVANNAAADWREQINLEAVRGF